MVFQHTISISGALYEPLTHMADGEIPVEIGLTMEDLVDEQVRIRELHNQLNLDDGGVITVDRTRYANNIFELCTEPARTIFSEQLLQGDSIKNRQVYAVKGGRYWRWLSESLPRCYKNKFSGTERRYPILSYLRARLPLHQYYGGETLNFAHYQYVNGLVLNALTQRHNIPQATIYPLKIIQCRELPVEEDGEILPLTLDKYCDPTYAALDSITNFTSNFSLLTEVQANQLCQFFYVGDRVDARVPLPTFNDAWDQRHYTSGILAMGCASERWKQIEEFATRLACLLEIVYSYGSSFSVHGPRNVVLSSLLNNNVSLSGIVCDLDTLSFLRGDDSSQLQNWDVFYAMRTIADYANLYEDVVHMKDPGSDNEKNPGMIVGWNKAATLRFAEQAMDVSSDIYRPDPRIVRLVFDVGRAASRRIKDYKFLLGR